MNDIKVEQFDYERMKENLNSVNEYISATYANKLDMQNSKNVKEALMKYMNYKVVEHYQVKQPELKEIYNFVATEYFKYREEVQTDIKMLNNSNETIKNMVNQVVDAENQQNAANESFEFGIDMILGEADTDPKQTYTDGEGIGTDPNNKEQAEKRKSVTKSVTTYMAANTKILSAKMSILSRAKREAFMTLNHFYNSKKTNATAVEPKNKTENINTDKVATVDTTIGKK